MDFLEFHNLVNVSHFWRELCLKIWNVGLLGYIEFEVNLCQIDNWINDHEEFKSKLIILNMMESRRRTLTTIGMTCLFQEYWVLIEK